MCAKYTSNFPQYITILNIQYLMLKILLEFGTVDMLLLIEINCFVINLKNL